MSTQKNAASALKALLEREKAPETHLIKTVAFWASILLPLLIGAALAIAAGINEQKTWEFTSKGYNAFLNDFKLPIGVMGLAIPLGALSAAIHRSIQTSRQITEQSSQNIFSNYLQHRTHFFDFIEENKPFEELTVDSAILYEFLFKRASEGNLRPNSENIQAVYTVFRVAIRTIELEYIPQLSERNLDPNSKNTVEAIDSGMITSKSLLGLKLENTYSGARLRTYRYVFATCALLQKTAHGLYKSGNFHKQYLSAPNFIEINEGFERVKKELAKFQDLVNITEGIFQTLKNHGYSREQKSITKVHDSGLQQGLKDMDRNLIKNEKTEKQLETVFKEQLDDDERALLKKYSPARWQMILSYLE